MTKTQKAALKIDFEEAEKLGNKDELLEDTPASKGRWKIQITGGK